MSSTSSPSPAAEPGGAPSQCIVTDSWHDSVVVIRCTGDVDMLTVPALDRQIDTALTKKPTSMIIDLTAVEFLASVGMGLLVEAHDRCGAATQFMVVADGPATSRPMQMIGLADIMSLHSTVEQAFDSIVR
ncbi:anti-anti-sigma factor [Mycolicibacterium chubuense]|jgi:anti-anti-sigma factor|uniref:Anti-sigma factor antagonist n=1 Tax=Mycolicibacterium chubuense TaxID=1800 RepID=A0A0J6WJT9_MYCCU|nr:STAS domain-containing protein [Mycolicibacterium chubuense]KMO83575.1 Anti-sigma-F factor antagonist RsfB [Mycolicibacterium chubuense]ORA53988.1 anti-anti-sigma factor [Mycolicibacterium chubuense]SPX95505.1 anti-anti-sigma factor [Mycolicibacterium chubuense]